MAGRDRVDPRVVPKPVAVTNERRVGNAVRQRFAIASDPSDHAAFFGHEVVDALVFDWLSVDLKDTIDHLNAVARQADDALDVVYEIVLRQAKHHHITALRFGRKQTAGKQPRRKRQRVVRVAVESFETNR